jgi:thiol:disulfide interchange protein
MFPRYEQNMRRLFAFLFVFLLAAPAFAGAPHVQVRLVPDRLAVAPGGRLRVALEQSIAPGWHTYWKNPGDAGAATDIVWSLPPGWLAGDIQWPYPVREPVGPLMDYGFEGKVWLLIDLAAPKNAAPGSEAHFSAHVEWLVCREVCVPEDAMVELTLFVETAAPPPDAISAERFAAARAVLPAASPWPASVTAKDGLTLRIASPTLGRSAREAVFFPARTGLILDAAPQTLEREGSGIALKLKPSPQYSGGPLDGVLVLTSTDGSHQALEIRAAPVAAAANGGPLSGLVLALAFAFLGGLILNIMPCVLPVLAMKALALAQHGGAERKKARAEALAYCYGAVASFVALGLLLAALQAGGAAIGWGFQLQEPPVVAGLALVLFAVGLSLSGVFEIAPVAAGESLTHKTGLSGAFFTGVLAVAVAAPCTAPFMASAIGFGLTQGPAVIAGVFAALGAGFALPFLLIGLIPALHRMLPKPGAWMVRFKQIMALPMYGAAAWLLWVLKKQTAADGLLLALAACAALGAGLWLWGATRGSRRVLRGMGSVLAVAGIAGALIAVAAIRPAPPPSSLPDSAESYSAARLALLRAQHRAVFVDATASWCITCLVNEEAALSRPKVRAAFKAKNVAVLTADWTGRDAEITRLLEAHGRSGVPLYLYYAPGAADAKILPQILTEGEVLRTIGAE